MITITNPISMVLDAATACFPDIDCDVEFTVAPEQGPYGQTFWPDDGGRTRVQVAVGIPFEAVLEVLAHELAHVAAGADAGHGPAWEDAFKRIHVEYNRIAGV